MRMLMLTRPAVAPHSSPTMMVLTIAPSMTRMAWMTWRMPRTRGRTMVGRLMVAAELEAAGGPRHRPRRRPVTASAATVAPTTASAATVAPRATAAVRHTARRWATSTRGTNTEATAAVAAREDVVAAADEATLTTLADETRNRSNRAP